LFQLKTEPTEPVTTTTTTTRKDTKTRVSGESKIENSDDVDSLMSTLPPGVSHMNMRESAVDELSFMIDSLEGKDRKKRPTTKL